MHPHTHAGKIAGSHAPHRPMMFSWPLFPLQVHSWGADGNQEDRGQEASRQDGSPGVYESRGAEPRASAGAQPSSLRTAVSSCCTVPPLRLISFSSNHDSMLSQAASRAAKSEVLQTHEEGSLEVRPDLSVAAARHLLGIHGPACSTTRCLVPPRSATGGGHGAYVQVHTRATQAAP